MALGGHGSGVRASSATLLKLPTAIVAFLIAGSTCSVAATAAVGTPAWHTSIVASTLNAGGPGLVAGISCPRAGECAAGGDFSVTGGTQAFLASEVGGHWRRGLEVAGSLNTGNAAEIAAVSCSSPGNCGAGGSYTESSHSQAFVVTETAGHWGGAVEVARSLNTGGSAYVKTMSCTGTGDCTVGGAYQDAAGSQAFVATESRGTWKPAMKVAGALNSGANAAVNSVSCTSPGNCTAGGTYGTSSSPSGNDPFVISESNGHWGAALEVASNINTDNQGAINAISCPTMGACVAVGTYTGSVGTQGFIVVQSHGSWRSAVEVRGSPANPLDRPIGANSISCAHSNYCSAGGSVEYPSGTRAYVVNEVNGHWGSAQIVAQSLNTDNHDFVVSVSCASPGNCAAVGDYLRRATFTTEHDFAVLEVGGHWKSAAALPGTNSTDNNGVYTVSCAPRLFHCGAGGQLTQNTGRSLGAHAHAFVSST